MLLNGIGIPSVNTLQGRYLSRLVDVLLNHPSLGVTFEHFRARRVGTTNFLENQPDYLAANAGEFDAGVYYVPDAGNPYRGCLCPIRKRPVQEKAGIYYVAEFELVMAHDPGVVFSLDDRLPKLQDRFRIRDNWYYAVAPAIPCHAGETVVLYQVPVSHQRYEVGSDAAWYQPQG